MNIFKQGENYEEENPPEQETETNEEMPSIINSNNIKFMVILGIAIIVIIFLIFSFSQKKKTPVSDTKTTSEDQDAEDWNNFVAQQESAPDTTTTSTIDNETAKKLRAWGYTGDEIEWAVSNNINIDSLIAEAKSEKESVISAEANKLAKTTSPEYRKLLDMTWLGVKPINLKDLSESDSANFEINTVTYNADYKKCISNENQLFLRLTLENGTYAFMTVTPDRWVRLRQTGNIVVNYDLYTYGSAKIITRIEEVNTDGSN
jgi:hypothetical protein